MNIISQICIGMEVYTEDGEQFGILKDVMETGANDVYMVSRGDTEKCCFRQSMTVFWMLI